MFTQSSFFRTIETIAHQKGIKPLEMYSPAVVEKVLSCFREEDYTYHLIARSRFLRIIQGDRQTGELIFTHIVSLLIQEGKVERVFGKEGGLRKV